MPLAPQGQSLGQSFMDLASGTNRPQLNAFVANSQARNGLLSAQTQDAVIKAQQAQEEQAAYDAIPQQLQDLYPNMKPSETQLARTLFIHDKSSETAMQSLARLKLMQGTPDEQVRGAQGAEGKLVSPPTVGPNYLPVPGTTGAFAGQAPSQTPEEIAKANSENANAGLHVNQTTNPNLYHTGGTPKLDPVQAAEVAQFIRQNPNAAGNLRGLIAGGAGADVIHAFLHPDPNDPTTPPNGISPAPGVSLAEQAAIRKNYASGVAGRQTGFLGTMIQHSQIFDAIADQLDNGNNTPTNYISQLWARTFGGSAVPTNLNIAGSFLAREAVRATVNSGAGTGEERELNDVNANSSPQALHGAADTLRSLAHGQWNTLDLAAQRGGVDASQLLVPEAKAAFGVGPRGVAAPQTAGDSGDNTHVGVPSYPNEAAARAAGKTHASGVISIGGVEGTLD